MARASRIGRPLSALSPSRAMAPPEGGAPTDGRTDIRYYVWEREISRQGRNEYQFGARRSQRYPDCDPFRPM